MALSSPAAMAWYRVVHGEIPPEDAAALMESIKERELARQVFATPTHTQREACLAALLDRLAAEEAGTAGGGAPTRDGEPEETALPLPGLPGPAARVVRPRRWRRGMVLAVAAAAFVLVPLLSQPDSALSTTYALDPFTGDATWRGPSHTAPLPAYSRASNLHLVLRPTDPVAGPVTLAAFARSSAGQRQRIELQPRIASNGLISVDLPIRDTGLHAGEWELVLVVGRPHALPSSWEELERAERAAQAGDAPVYEVLRTVIRVES